MRIVLTGGIACGKSQFAKFLRELGVLTLDADDIVHEIIPLDERRRIADRIFADPEARRELESRIHPLVRARFDQWFSQPLPSGAIEKPNRGVRGAPALPDGMVGSRVPRDRGVEGFAITSPLTSLTSLSSLNSLNSLSSLNSLNSLKPLKSLNSLPLRLAIIPLLFECNWQDDYDIILCISSPAETQIRRMVETRAMTREQAMARLSAQLPVSEKVARSHYVIVNDSTLEHLRDEAFKCVEWLTARIRS